MFHEGHSTAAVQRFSGIAVCHMVSTPQYIEINSGNAKKVKYMHLLLQLYFIPTYHSLHVCSYQALLCAKLAACHVPLVDIVIQLH